MVDIMSAEKRSRLMSKIRGRNTGIEKKTRKMLRSHRIKFRQHPKIYGNPDFLVGQRTLVFCDGGFGHGFEYEKRKKSPKKFWRNKIEGNIQRDRKVSRKLRCDGYSVIRLWGHDIENRPNVCLNRLSGS